MDKNPLEVINKNDEELFNIIASTKKMAFEDSALSLKNKLLIALAIDAAHGSETGVKSLAKQAIDAGATKEEIMDALRVTYYITGVASIYTAARALSDVL